MSEQKAAYRRYSKVRSEPASLPNRRTRSQFRTNHPSRIPAITHPTNFALLWIQRHFITRFPNPYIADTPTRHPLTMQQFPPKRMNQRRARVLIAAAARVLLAAAPRVLIAVALTCALSGCSRLRPHPADTYVYVTAKQTFLRDRVAAVSNRTGTATNGEQLVVLEHARRWVKVRTPSGEIGWIEERLTAPEDLADKFDALRKDHAKDPVVATATTSDDAYLHVAPGRLTDKLYLLSPNGTLSLLQRASVVKPVTPGAQPAPASTDPNAPPAGPIYEDWWLVRDAKGQTGWVYSRLLEVSAPDSLLRYAEGQRIVGAYILTHVDDPASGILDNGNTITSIPVYVTVLSPYKAGLPYDFNQVRVFTWNIKKHRYETGFAERDIVGYLPVKMGATRTPTAREPSPPSTPHLHLPRPRRRPAHPHPDPPPASSSPAAPSPRPTASKATSAAESSPLASHPSPKPTPNPNPKRKPPNEPPKSPPSDPRN